MSEDFSSENKSTIAFKKLFNKAHTSPNKALGNELIASNVSLADSTIFGEALPSDPENTPGTVVEKVTFTLVEDATAPGYTWRLQFPSDYAGPLTASKADTFIYQYLGAVQLVPPTYGSAYTAKVKDSSGNELSFSDGAFFIDYYAGIFFQKDANQQAPATVEAFVYTGKMLNQVVSDLQSNAQITSATIVSDEIKLTLSNGNEVTVSGSVIGPQGPAGEAGAPGAAGQNGVAGVSISSAAVNTGGELILTLSDTSVVNVGVVKGTDGLQGNPGSAGTDGVGVQNVAITNNELIVTLTDNTVSNLGNVKGDTGPQGIPGENGTNGTIGPQGPRGDQGETGPQGDQGVQGIQGPAGTGITFKGTVSEDRPTGPNTDDVTSSTETFTPSQGDAVINDNNDKLFIYDGTGWVNGGSIQGPQGVPGGQGPQGDTGEAGPQGEQGIPGAAGASITVSSIINNNDDTITITFSDNTTHTTAALKGDTGSIGPQGIPGEDGDSAYEVWKTISGNENKTLSEFTTDITGPTGPAGQDGADANNNDIAATLSATNSFITSVASNSTLSTNVANDLAADSAFQDDVKGDTGDQGQQGAPGTDGATWTTGTEAPSNGDGNDGDFYFKSNSKEIYKKASGSWSLLADITGDQGPQGETGPQGDQGVAGPSGAADIVTASDTTSTDKVWAVATINTLLQAKANASDIPDVSNFITGYTVSQGDVIAHQGALSIAKSQIAGFLDSDYQPADSNIVSDANYVATDNNYTTAEKSKLAGIDISAKDDQTAQEIVTSIGNDTTAEADLKTVLGITDTLDTAAYTPTSDYATAAQGALADSALQAHPSVSAASSSDNSGRTYIQDIGLDSFGHVTSIGTATEDVVNTDTTYSAASGGGLSVSSEQFSIDNSITAATLNNAAKTVNLSFNAKGLITSATLQNIAIEQSQVNALESDLTTINTNIASNDSDISSLSTRMTTAESDIADLETDVASNTSSISTNSSNISSLTTTQSSHAATLTSLQNQITSNDTDISTNATNISSNDTDIAGLNTRLITAESDIDSAESNISTLQSSIGTLSDLDTSAQGTLIAAINELHDEIDTNAADITSNDTDITALQTLANTHETAIGLNDNGTYTAIVDANYADGSSLKTAVTQLDTQVKTSAGSIEALEVRDGGLILQTTAKGIHMPATIMLSSHTGPFRVDFAQAIANNGAADLIFYGTKAKSHEDKFFTIDTTTGDASFTG